MKQQQVSLGELALELGVNKSKLAYYFSVGLLKPVSKIGRMNVFDRENTVKMIKNIQNLKNTGKTLKEIKNVK